MALPRPGAGLLRHGRWPSTTLERRAWLLSSGWPETTPAGPHAPAPARAAGPVRRLARRRAPSPSRCRRSRARCRSRSNFTRAGLRGGGRAGGRLHPGRRHLPGQPLAALPGRAAGRAGRRAASTGGCGARNPAPFAAFLDFGETADRLGLARALPASCAGGRSRPGRSRARGRAGPRRRRTRGSAAELLAQREGPGRERDDRRPPAQRPVAGSAATTPCSRPRSACWRASPPCTTWSRP